MKKGLVMACLAILCGGCRESSQLPRDMVLIGEKSSPDYDEILVGSRFGAGRKIMVYGNEAFGRLAVTVNQEATGTHRSGGEWSFQRTGASAIRGSLGKDLKMYRLKLEDGAYVVMEKGILKGEVDFRLKF